MKMTRWMVAIALVAFLAGIAGVYIGRTVTRASAPGTEFHDVLHHQLMLDSRQERRLESLEQRFAIRRRALELQLRAANARLASAIEVEHGNGPKVTAAVDASHAAMGELQRETLAHIFSMRQILRPDQARKFDLAVVKALTVDAR
jgi:hypothetical protein